MSQVNERPYDLIVIGLGGMGSAVAAHAARRGLHVLGLERFDPVHDRGASTGGSRIIRKAYFEEPAYVPMLLRAYELWRELEAATGSDILRITGMVMVGRADSPILDGARTSAQLHDLPLEVLSPQAAAVRYPALALRSDEIALFEADAGFVRPEAAIEAHLAVARSHGATLRFQAAVGGWDVQSSQRATVTLVSGETFVARSLALCLGPWFVEHAQSLGVQLRVQRNVQMWFDTVDPRGRIDRLPVFFADRPDYPNHLYGFPDFGDGLKAAFHGYGETTHPDALRRDVSAAEVAQVRAALDELLPGVAGELRSTKACMYSLTPDEHFVVDRHPRYDNVIVAGGFSGHGFKFCSTIGEVVTDLVVDGRSARHDIGFLSSARFARSVASGA